MKYIYNNSFNPHFNLAFEEYVMKHMDQNEDYFFLWRDNPVIVVGRNQNTIKEINLDYIENNNIDVVRRLSGGGAVYHDRNNINFTFITTKTKNTDFKFFTKPVIEALKKLNINAEFSGRNDLLIDGKKFSGNAQYHHNNRILHHGTLLFNSDLSVVEKALNVSKEKIESKGIKSVKSRVTNIYDYLEEKITVEEFMNILINEIVGDLNAENQIYPDSYITDKVDAIKKERYDTYKWNFGESPDYTLHNKIKFAYGLIELYLGVSNGLIENCIFRGDFFGIEDIEIFEKNFIGQKYEIKNINDIINSSDLNKYILNASSEDILKLFMF